MTSRAWYCLCSLRTLAEMSTKMPCSSINWQFYSRDCLLTRYCSSVWTESPSTESEHTKSRQWHKMELRRYWLSEFSFRSLVNMSSMFYTCSFKISRMSFFEDTFDSNALASPLASIWGFCLRFYNRSWFACSRASCARLFERARGNGLWMRN